MFDINKRNIMTLALPDTRIIHDALTEIKVLLLMLCKPTMKTKATI